MRTQNELLNYVNSNITRLTTQQLNADDDENYNDGLYGQTDDFLEVLENISMALSEIKPKPFDRDDFMEFFRGEEPDGSDDLLNQLSVDDRIEVFSHILLGSSDFTKELLDSVLADYCVDTLEVIEI